MLIIDFLYFSIDPRVHMITPFSRSSVPMQTGTSAERTGNQLSAYVKDALR